MGLMKKGCFIALSVFVFVVCGEAVEIDSSHLQISIRPAGDAETWHGDSVKRYNPVIPGVASLIIPGAGQVVTGHYVKGIFFAGLEAIFASSVYFWQSTGRQRDDEANQYVRWSMADTGKVQKAVDLEKSNFSHHSAIEARFTSYSFLSWAVGTYVYSELDAIGGSNFWKDTKERSPGKAGLLSAIPGLGLGQLYNGSVSKAGMVMMGQVSLGMMAYGNQRLMTRAEDNYFRLNAAQDSVGKQLVQMNYPSDWNSSRYRSFTNRNLYLWYSLFFYFYGIFDAVVDAYLHDYPEKMNIKPDLAVGYKQFTFSLNTTF
jgi:hypothetical protein